MQVIEIRTAQIELPLKPSIKSSIHDERVVYGALIFVDTGEAVHR